MINLEDDDPVIFELLLSYLYTLDYDDGCQLKRKKSLPTTKSTTDSATSVADQDEADSVLVPALTDAGLDEAIRSQSESDIVAEDRLSKAQAPITESSGKDGRTSLMINVQVYAMADKFDVAELKLLAKEKFLTCAQGWPLPDFPSVVREALSSTPESDHGLRDILNRILADHVDDICPVPDSTLNERLSAVQETRQQWCNALRDEGRFLYEVLGTVAVNKAREIERLRFTNVDIVADLQDAQQEIDDLKTQSTSVQAQRRLTEQILDRVKARGASLIQEIDTRDNCRHCHQPFQPAFEGISNYDEWHQSVSLRCKNCRTKHNF